MLRPRVGLPLIWTVGGVLNVNQHPFGAQQRAEYVTPEGAQGPEAPP